MRFGNSARQLVWERFRPFKPFGRDRRGFFAPPLRPAKPSEPATPMIRRMSVAGRMDESSGLKKVDLQVVLSQLEDIDGTGDPEWVQTLQDDARPFKDWAMVALPLKYIELHCIDQETARDYAEQGMDRMPPIVVIPGEHSKRLTVLDGGHRALACAYMKSKVVPAYVPYETAVSLKLDPW